MKTFKFMTKSINYCFFNIQRRKNRCGPMFYTHIAIAKANTKRKALVIVENRMKKFKYNGAVIAMKEVKKWN